MIVDEMRGMIELEELKLSGINGFKCSGRPSPTITTTRLVDASLYLQIEECEEVDMFLLVARPLLDAKTKLKI